MREDPDRPKLQLHHGTVEIERKFLVASDETLGKPGPSSLDAALTTQRQTSNSATAMSAALGH
jgi:hypothetical protein